MEDEEAKLKVQQDYQVASELMGVDGIDPETLRNLVGNVIDRYEMYREDVVFNEL